ncbi:glycosyltransferase family 39 protein [Bdellovibrio bacteriovorus]|uniref:ArnT family glycosyltransferase n=1 Tax=Bdellovibrio bacteriovorus TaxID=959 RepID=UPI0021D37D4F|nr:glycosyltransferase family 39 protein [Bdellovibrio bacteriovorus]UXR64077.1 glycosyltransferase family 39 protein [Bdellovibrio bacteriovorus]
MKRHVAISSSFCLIVGLVGMALAFSWLFALTPRPRNIEIIRPNLTVNTRALSSFNYLNYNTDNEGLYWLKFDTAPMIYPLSRLKMRTMNCVHEMNTNHGDWKLPSGLQNVCDNREGLLLINTAPFLATKTQWRFAGSTRGDSYGVLLEKDWTDLPVAAGLMLLTLSLALILYARLPAHHFAERLVVVSFLILAFLFRFWLVFIEAPPQFSLFSDMGAYFSRSEEILRGHFRLDQLFQPIGFTLWSLWLRELGDFELFNWAQVFFSWGTVVLIYLMVRERFGSLAGAISVLISAAYVPLAGFATFHMAENAYAFFISLILWLILRTLKNQKLRGFFLIGLFMATAFYFKGNHAFFIPFFALWLLYRDRHHFTKGIAKVTLLGLGCTLVVAPHMAWTWKHYGKPQLGPTAGALNFVEGKCPSKDNEDSTGARWMSPMFGFTNERIYKKWDRPFTDQTYFWNAGFNCVKQDPMVLVSSLRYIYYLAFGNPLWPHISTDVQKLYYPWENFFYYGMLPLTLLGLLILRKDKEAFNQASALLMLSLFLTVWFFKSENRFRVPFDALLIAWSSVGASWALLKVLSISGRLTVHLRNLFIKAPVIVQITHQEKPSSAEPNQS